VSLLVYAVVERPAAGTLRRRGLRFVEVDGLLAAVRTARRAPTPTARGLRRHDEVVRALADAAPAVVPVRFATLLEDADALRRALAPRLPELRRALALVRGRVQMTLRVWQPAGREASPAPPRPAPDAPAAGKRYLQTRAEWWRAADVPGLASVLDALRPLTAAERIERHATPPLTASVYHLVDRAHTATYRRAVQRQRSGLRLRLSGPWPPYAFAPEVAG
jgi:hypothetical protein